MTDRHDAPERRRRRSRALVTALTVGLALLLGACSISAEDSPRPIMRETTIAPPATDAP